MTRVKLINTTRNLAIKIKVLLVTRKNYLKVGFDIRFRESYSEMHSTNRATKAEHH